MRFFKWIVTCLLLSIPGYNGFDDTGCEYDEEFYENGEEWSPDACTSCKCVLGNTICDTEECPSIECKTQKYIPLGKCCPRCVGRFTHFVGLVFICYPVHKN